MNDFDIIKAQLQRIETLTLLSAKDVFTAGEAALILGVSVHHVHRLVSEGKVTYFKPQGKINYFKRADLEAFMLQNRQPSTAELQQGAAYQARVGRAAANTANDPKGGAAR